MNFNGYEWAFMLTAMALVIFSMAKAADMLATTSEMLRQRRLDEDFRRQLSFREQNRKERELTFNQQEERRKNDAAIANIKASNEFEQALAKQQAMWEHECEMRDLELAHATASKFSKKDAALNRDTTLNLEDKQSHLSGEPEYTGG